MTQRPAPSERGSATVLVLGVCLLTVVLLTTVAALGSALVARHRAESVADLAALAAADVLVGRAAGQPCAAARAAVAANSRGDVTVVECRPERDAVEVEVTVRPVGWVAAVGSATARARAGPATSPPP
ncbi:MAG TPA: Rv3654c family TadE-like protein [Actinomycetales bacterium]|nr:Rv3654c family TadE-like protein [Actinomycetales bacterium]